MLQGLPRRPAVSHSSARHITRRASKPCHVWPVACSTPSHGALERQVTTNGGVKTMRRAIKSLLLVAAIAVVWAPVQARADGYLSPWGGVNFGGGSSVDNGRAAMGVNAGF